MRSRWQPSFIALPPPRRGCDARHFRTLFGCGPGCALRRREVAALTDGRSSGEFTLAGGDGRRTAREYAGPVGVVTGPIASAISDRASSRALRVLGAAERVGCAPRRRSCRVSARWRSRRRTTRLLAPELAAGIARVKSANSIRCVYTEQDTGVQSGNSGWYDTREPYRELRVPSDDAASGDEGPAGLGGVAAGRAVAAIRGHGHGRARVLMHSGRSAVGPRVSLCWLLDRRAVRARQIDRARRAYFPGERRRGVHRRRRLLLRVRDQCARDHLRGVLHLEGRIRSVRPAR